MIILDIPRGGRRNNVCGCARRIHDFRAGKFIATFLTVLGQKPMIVSSREGGGSVSTII